LKKIYFTTQQRSSSHHIKNKKQNTPRARGEEEKKNQFCRETTRSIPSILFSMLFAFILKLKMFVFIKYFFTNPIVVCGY